MLRIKKLPHPPSWQLILGLRTAIVVNSASATTRLSGFLSSAYENYRRLIPTKAVSFLLTGIKLKISDQRIQQQEESFQKVQGDPEKAGET